MMRVFQVLLIAVCLGVGPAAQTRKPAAMPSPAAKPAVKKTPAVKLAVKPPVKPPVKIVKKEQAVPFRPGETLTYDIGWSSYVTAGTATIAVQQKRASYGSTAYYVVAEGRPTSLVAKLYTLYYKVDTLLDVYSLLPQRGSVYAEEGKRRRMKTTLFDQAAKRVHYEVQTATLAKKDMAVPAYAQDALSALYVLRSIPLETGDTFHIPIADNGHVYKVQMTVGNVEPVQTALGSIHAIKVTPRILTQDAKGAAPGRGMAMWLSNDARRLPVRIEAQLVVGKFTLILRQATGG